MIANFDLDWVVYRGGLAGDRRWHRVRCLETGNIIEYPIGVHKKEIIAQLKQQLSSTLEECRVQDPEHGHLIGWEEYYDFLEKGRESDPLPLVLHNCKVLVEKALSNLSVDSVRFFISPRDGSNWRNSYATERKYKGNRSSSDKPVYYDEIQDYLIRKYNAFVCYGFEADDYVSYLQDDNTVLVDNDKDTMMVPGRHYNPVKDKKSIVTEEEGEFNFFKQLLTGDSADNIGGLHRVGNKTAEKILKNGLDKFDNYEDLVYDYYIQSYGDRAMGLMIERGNLLWMPRPGREVWIPKGISPYDFRLPNKLEINYGN